MVVMQCRKACHRLSSHSVTFQESCILHPWEKLKQTSQRKKSSAGPPSLISLSTTAKAGILRPWPGGWILREINGIVDLWL